MSAIEQRLTELGLHLPAPPAAPPGVRLPFEFVRVRGDLAYVSGHGPLDGDRVLYIRSAAARAASGSVPKALGVRAGVAQVLGRRVVHARDRQRPRLTGGQGP